jgi:hypothetical protein
MVLRATERTTPEAQDWKDVKAYSFGFVPKIDTRKLVFKIFVKLNSMNFQEKLNKKNDPFSALLRV